MSEDEERAVKEGFKTSMREELGRIQKRDSMMTMSQFMTSVRALIQAHQERLTPERSALLLQATNELERESSN